MANEFKYTIRADDKSRQATQSAQRNMGKTEQAAQKLGKTLKTAFTVGALLAVGRTVQKVSRELINAYSEQERAERKLAAAVSTNPLLDDRSADRLRDFASELQQITTVGDEVSIDLAAMASSWGRNETEIKSLIGTAADLSATLGIDLKMAARGVNNVMDGNVQTLSRYIPELRELSDAQIENGEAMELLEKRFGGMAEELKETTDGALKDFNNAWGDLKEVLGEGLAPMFTATLEFLTGVVQKIGEMVNQTRTMRQLTDYYRRGAMGMAAEDISSMTNQEVEEFANAAREMLMRSLRDMPFHLMDLPDQLQGRLSNLDQLSDNQLANAVTELTRVLPEGNAYEGMEVVAQDFKQLLSMMRTRENPYAYFEQFAPDPEQVETGQSGPSPFTQAINEELERLRQVFNENNILMETFGRDIDMTDEMVSAIGTSFENLASYANETGEMFNASSPGLQRFLSFVRREFPEAAAQLFANMESGVGEPAAEVQSTLTSLDLQFGKTSGHVETMGAILRRELIPDLSDASLAIRGFGEQARGATPSPGGGIGSEEFTEGVEGAAGAASSGSEEGGATGLGAVFGAIAGPIGILIGYLMELLEKIKAVKALMAPITIVIDGFLDVLGPVVNEGLAPLVGIFHMLGQMLARLLIPILEIFVPVIEAMGKAFVWLYNSIFVPVHNQFKTWGNHIYNFFAGLINGVIDMMNQGIAALNKLLPRRRKLDYLSRVGTRGLDEGHLDPITYDDLTDAGEGYVGEDGGGSPASYTTGRNITINMEVYTDALVGEDGISEFAVMIRDEIRAAEALGA